MQLNLDAMAPVPHTIDIGDAGTFEVYLRPPTYRELLEDYAEANLIAKYERRLRVAIARWDGIEDLAGQPILYSLQNLQRVCELYPAALEQLMVAVRDVFGGRVRWGDLDPKKPEPGLPGFSADVVLTSLKSLPISPSGEQVPSPVPLAPQPQS